MSHALPAPAVLSACISPSGTMRTIGSGVNRPSEADETRENEIPDPVINDGVIKTVAAFLNSDGGTLGIGITDDGDISGIQPDLDHKRFDLDQYQNWLSTLLVSTIGSGVVGAHVGFRIEPVGSEAVCLVDVSPAPAPVYAKTTKGKACFFARIGNTSRMLEGPDIHSYIEGHWKN